MKFSTYWSQSLLNCRSRRNAKLTRRRLPGTSASAVTETLESRTLLTAGIGLQAQYFDSVELSDPVLVRVDSQVNFDWAAGTPDSAIPADAFAVRWSGQIEATHTETHTFTVTTNDKARLWVNGQLLVAESHSGDGTIDLIAGRRYDIQLEYVAQTGDAVIALEWRSDSLPQQTIPATQLFPASLGSVSTEEFSGSVDFSRGPDSTASLSSFETVASDNVAERISGWLHATETGPYRFFIAADNSAELWLSHSDSAVGKRKIAEVTNPTTARNFTAHANQQAEVVYLVAGQSYYIEALHSNTAGVDHLSVAWMPPGQNNITVIPGDRLSPVLQTVRIYADSPNTAEGADPARFTVVRDGAAPNDPLTVHYTTIGTAISGTDYLQLPGSITIPAGAISATLELSALADTTIEADETAMIELQAGSGYEVGRISERTVHAKIQDDALAPAGGAALWSAPALNQFTFFGGNFTTTFDAILGDILQAEIDTLPEDVYSAQLTSSINSAVSAGDILLLEFRAKSIGDAAEVSAVFEQAGGEYTKSLLQGVTVGNQWQKVQIPFVAAENHAAGEANFGFYLGQQIQTVQFAELQILNFGQPQSLIEGLDLAVYEEAGDWGTGEPVPVSSRSLPIAYQIETSTVPPEAWQLQAWQRNVRGIDSGETMRIEFSARATSAVAQAEFLVQRTDTFRRLLSDSISLSSEWQSFTYELTASRNFDVNDLQIAFDVGFGLQTIQIAEITWKNVSHQLDLADLPRQLPAASYEGRSGTNAWRIAADTRIEDVRKKNVTINVVDVNGTKLDGALIVLRQNSHAFQFGSAISALDGNLATDGTDQALKYQSEITRLFNTVVIESSLKWPRFEDARQPGIDGAAFADANDLYLRGHNIVWPGRENMPASVWNEYDSRLIADGETAAGEWLKTTVKSHVADMASTFAGLVSEWDVMNEPFDNHDVMDILGDQIVIDWYRQVRDADPNALLTLNDYDIFSGNGNNVEHRNRFEFWLTTLAAVDLLDVIGEQGHYNDANLTDIAELGNLIARYNTDFDTPIAITEFDVDSLDEQLQADYLRDYLTMAFSQPGVSKFLQWGFWEGAHYLPQAALYHEDFSIKPNGQVYEDLVFGNWWTDVRGTTLDGKFSVTAFQGRYDLTVEYDNQTYTAIVLVDEAGTSQLTMNLPVEAISYYVPILESASMAPVVALPVLAQAPSAQSSGQSLLDTANEIADDAVSTWQTTRDEVKSLFPVDEVKDGIETVTEVVEDVKAIDEVLKTVGSWLKIFP